MKNLKRIFIHEIRENSNLKGAECFCVGLSDSVRETTDTFGYVIFFYRDGCLYSTNNEDKENCCKLYDLRHYYQDVNCNLISISIEYSYLTSALIFALANGDVFSFELDANNLQCIGSVESGLKAMEFSPDMETVAFATGEGTIILMSGSFDPIIEIDLNSSDVGEKQMVNVGWGKKETQFHGSEGKSAAKAKPVVPEITDITDDHRTRISWRGDSSFFAVIFWCEESNGRRVRIYNEEGVHQCNSETLPGLGQSICWRPSGNLIAFTQKLPNKNVIGFIEKNGLRHGEFVLPAEIEIREIVWNVESTILCLVCEKIIQLWTMGNFHWYLKQQIDCFSSNIVSVRWDTNCSNTLHVLLSDGTYSVHRWIWAVDRTSSILEKDGAFVAVIDGNKVLLTSFKKAIIPPPMSMSTLEFSCPVNAVSFIKKTNIGVSNSDGDKAEEYSVNDIAVFLSDNTLAFVSMPEFLSGDMPKIDQIFKIENYDIIWLHHWLWLSPDILVCCGVKPGKYYLCELTIDRNLKCVSVDKSTVLNYPVLSLTDSSVCNEVILQMINGKLEKYVIGSNLITDLLLLTSLPEPCTMINFCGDNIIALNERNCLYFNDKLISNKATSFFVQPPYILVTSSEHSLLIFKSSDFNVCEHISSRKLERGSKIVTVLNDSVVLQLPRGNLETIQPRTLILRTAADLLDKLQYRKLFSLMRRQRLHMNLFIDHHPQVFLLTVSKFIHQVDDPTLLNIFLSEINENDVTRTIYKNFYSQDKRPPILDKKVETVCRALRGAISQNEQECSKLLLPLLTTYVKTSEMSEALLLASKSDQALQHLLFLVDVDKLYEIAISLYNLEMAMKIAGKSQKDPKEYIPYLNNLKNMDPCYMKYTIDCKFKNYESALKHICSSSNEEHFHEAVQLIYNFSLYPLALHLYKDNQRRYQEVALLYGDYLFNKRCYEEAGLIFTRCGNLVGALLAYTKSGSWRDAILLAKELDYSDKEQKELGETLLNLLRNNESWNEAALFSKEVLQDSELAVDCFVNGRLWDQATYLARASNNPNLVESMVKPSLKETMNSLMDEIKQNLDKIEKHATRLTQVRVEKAQKKDNPAQDIDVSDLQSEASSASSYGSMRSGGTQSSKNTRKMQRKMWSLKEGNPREEFALLSAITQLLQTTEKMTGEVKSACLAAVRLNDDHFDGLAEKLQNLMAASLKSMEKVKKLVWSPERGVSDSEISTDVLDSQLKHPPASSIHPLWSLEILNMDTS